jgi:DNA-binding phage protein
MIVKTVSEVQDVASFQAGYLKKSYKEIAEEADVCERTVARFISGETQHPRFFTVVSILRALGYATSVAAQTKSVRGIRKAKVGAK